MGAAARARRVLLVGRLRHGDEPGSHFELEQTVLYRWVGGGELTNLLFAETRARHHHATRVNSEERTAHLEASFFEPRSIMLDVLGDARLLTKIHARPPLRTGTMKYNETHIGSGEWGHRCLRHEESHGSVR